MNEQEDSSSLNMLEAWDAWISELDDQPGFTTEEDQSDRSQVIFTLPNEISFSISLLQSGTWLLKIHDMSAYEATSGDQQMFVDKWLEDVEQEIQGHGFSETSAPSAVFQVVADTYNTVFEDDDVKSKKSSSDEAGGWGDQSSDEAADDSENE